MQAGPVRAQVNIDQFQIETRIHAIIVMGSQAYVKIPFCYFRRETASWIGPISLAGPRGRDPLATVPFAPLPSACDLTYAPAARHPPRPCTCDHRRRADRHIKRLLQRVSGEHL